MAQRKKRSSLLIKSAPLRALDSLEPERCQCRMAQPAIYIVLEALTQLHEGQHQVVVLDGERVVIREDYELRLRSDTVMLARCDPRFANRLLCFVQLIGFFRCHGASCLPV